VKVKPHITKKRGVKRRSISLGDRTVLAVKRPALRGRFLSDRPDRGLAAADGAIPPSTLATGSTRVRATRGPGSRRLPPR
jgi:hypothetical protein